MKWCYPPSFDKDLTLPPSTRSGLPAQGGGGDSDPARPGPPGHQVQERAGQERRRVLHRRLRTGRHVLQLRVSDADVMMY